MDGLLFVFLGVFALRGWFRGILLEVFSVGGLLAGLVAASAVFQWVGDHWVHAHPAWLYAVLRVLVAALAGLALVSVFHLIGTQTRDIVRRGPAAAIDGPLGVVAGLATGGIILTLALIGALLTPWPPEIAAGAARARLAVPVLNGAEAALDWSRDVVPGARWLRSRVQEAERRARAGGARPESSRV